MEAKEWIGPQLGQHMYIYTYGLVSWMGLGALYSFWASSRASSSAKLNICGVSSGRPYQTLNNKSIMLVC